MDPFLGQIMQVGFSFAPTGWATCAGQLIPVTQNPALYSLLGTAYGGNGQTNYGLPNLQGRMIVGVGSGPSGPYVPGQTGGAQEVALTLGNLPAHTHAATFTGTGGGGGSGLQVTVNAVQAAGTSATPTAGALLAESGTLPTSPKIYAPAGTSGTQVALGGVTASGGGGITGGTVTVAPTGGSLPVPTMPPFVAIQNIIALTGVFPTRS